MSRSLWLSLSIATAAVIWGGLLAIGWLGFGYYRIQSALRELNQSSTDAERAGELLDPVERLAMGFSRFPLGLREAILSCPEEQLALLPALRGSFKGDLGGLIALRELAGFSCRDSNKTCHFTGAASSDLRLKEKIQALEELKLEQEENQIALRLIQGNKSRLLSRHRLLASDLAELLGLRSAYDRLGMESLHVYESGPLKDLPLLDQSIEADQQSGRIPTQNLSQKMEEIRKQSRELVSEFSVAQEREVRLQRKIETTRELDSVLTNELQRELAAVLARECFCGELAGINEQVWKSGTAVCSLKN